MRNRQTPPPSLSQSREEREHLIDQFEKMKNETPKPPDVSFRDEFAPSSSPAREVGDTGILQTKAGRMVCYNDHVIEYMEGALERACELGLPRIFWSFPLQYPKVSDAAYRTIGPMVGALCDGLEEQSDDWLAVKCYLCWLDACHALTEGAPSLIVAERMFVAGATAREFELSIRNRAHSALGRKQKRHLTELREDRNRRAATNVEERRRTVAALLPETRLTGGALDKWLIRQLAERHGIRVSSRTARSDRKSVEG